MKNNNSTTTILKTIKLILINTLVTTLSIATPTPRIVHAQTQPFNISISPPILEITLKPNKSFIKAFTITNNGRDTVIIPKIVYATPIGKEGNTTITTTPSQQSMLSLNLENAEYKLNKPIRIKQNQKIQLVLRISSATTDVSQDEYLALAIQQQPTTNTANPTATPIITALILATITPDGNIPINLSLQDFTPPMIHDSTTTLTLHPTLKNNSQNMIRPKGFLTITNWRGHTVLKQPIYPHLILGNTTRSLKLSQKQNDQEIPTNMQWKPSIMDIGPHQITIEILSQNDKQLIKETKTTFLFPTQLTIYGIITILLLALIITTNKQKTRTK